MDSRIILSLSICFSLFLTSLAAKSTSHDELLSIPEQQQFLLEWQSRVVLKDTKASISCLDRLIAVKPDASQWGLHEISLASRSLRLSLQIEKIDTLYKQIKNSAHGKQSSKIVLEQYSWAILEIGIQACHPRVRLEALIGALQSSDAQSIPILCSSLQDQNLLVRNLALEMAGNFPDIEVQRVLSSCAKEGNKEERIRALKTLLQQGAINAVELTKKALEEEIWSVEERALIRVLLANIQSDIIPSNFSVTLFTSLVSTQKLDGKLAALEYASQFIDQQIPGLIIESIRGVNDHTIVQLKALEILGAHSFLLTTPEKEELTQIALGWMRGPIQQLQARAAWIIALISHCGSKNLECSYQWFLTAMYSERDSILQELAVTQLRALGNKSKNLVEIIITDIEKGKITLSYENQLTLGIHMLEQKQMINRAINFLQTGLEKTRNTYIHEKNSETAFSFITKNCEDSQYYSSLMRASIDLYTRLKILLLISHATNNKIAVEDIINLINGSDCLGVEFQLLQILYGELKIPLEEIQAIISDESTEKKLHTALAIAFLSIKDASIDLIHEIALTKPDLSHDEIALILSILSLFSVDHTQDIIASFLTESENPLSIRIKAAASFLSSIAQ